MQLSKHAKKRSQQRGIRQAVIELILEFGESRRMPGNVQEYRLRRKGRSRLIQLLDKAINVGVVVDDEESVVITTYHKAD